MHRMLSSLMKSITRYLALFVLYYTILAFIINAAYWKGIDIIEYNADKWQKDILNTCDSYTRIEGDVLVRPAYIDWFMYNTFYEKYEVSQNTFNVKEYVSPGEGTQNSRIILRNNVTINNKWIDITDMLEPTKVKTTFYVDHDAYHKRLMLKWALILYSITLGVFCIYNILPLGSYNDSVIYFITWPLLLIVYIVVGIPFLLVEAFPKYFE